jgi:hypothetical protein
MKRAFLIAFLVAACGGSSAAELPLAEVLATSGRQFDDLESVRFSIAVEGAPVSFDSDGTLTASSAVGQYDAPESFQALVEVSAFGLSAELGAISIGADRWITDPVTGEWERLDIGIGFDPLVLFDPDQGVGATVAALDATLVEFGSDYEITGTVGGPTVKVLTAGLLDEGELDIVLIVDAESLQITEIGFDTEAADGTSRWTIEFSEFDEPVMIDPPV